jgi:hypothetical protein
MVTRNELTYELLEALRSHIGDDEDIDLRQLESFVKDYRAEFAKQRFDKNPFMIDNSFIQTLPALIVDKVDSSSLSGSLSGRYLLKTRLAIPDTIRRNGYEGTILHVTSADKLDSSFTITDYAMAIEGGHGRFNRNEIFAFPYDGHIYLASKGDDFKTLYRINIRGVFTDPRAAYLIANNTTVYTGDENYYTPEDLKKVIITSILRDKYGILLNPPKDSVDDGDHELDNVPQRRR